MLIRHFRRKVTSSRAGRMEPSVAQRVCTMLGHSAKMVLKAILMLSYQIYFAKAWEFYKFLISMATGVFVSMLWYFFSGQNCFLFGLPAITTILCAIVLHFKKARKNVDGDDQLPASKVDCLELGAKTSEEEVTINEDVTENFIAAKRTRARRDDVDPTSNITNGPTDEEPPDNNPEIVLKELPVVPDPPKKNSRRQKKKRNSLKSNKSKYKSAMDDSNDTSSVSSKESYSKVDSHVPEKTKVYSPLQMYLELNLESYELYNGFRPYVLTKEQLKMYGFPRESPTHPGRIIPDPNLKKGSTERRCCRCGSVFFIHADGTYESKSSCRFHAQKQLPYRGEYPCCRGDYMSEGCVTWKFHVSAQSFLHDVEFVKARKKRHLNQVTASTIYAVDCEMCYTTAGMEVAKVGIVGVDGLTVFESFVLPEHQILDYNTRYSGVTEKDLMGVSTTLADVQAYLLKLLNKDSILVGHGLENDLKVLRFIHDKVVDTSVVFPHNHSKWAKKSLKNLASEFLDKSIQTSTSGHDCIEDARTCMELMLLKISNDFHQHLPLIQDENKNSILQNMQKPYVPIQNSWVRGYNYSGDSNSVYFPNYYGLTTPRWSYYGDSLGDNFYSNYLTPKKLNSRPNYPINFY